MNNKTNYSNKIFDSNKTIIQNTSTSNELINDSINDPIKYPINEFDELAKFNHKQCNRPECAYNFNDITCKNLNLIDQTKGADVVKLLASNARKKIPIYKTLRQNEILQSAYQDTYNS